MHQLAQIFVQTLKKTKRTHTDYALKIMGLTFLLSVDKIK